MNPTEKPRGSDDDSDESRDGEFPAVPDEDGPHDVPDDTVIEKTLPSAPVPGLGGSGTS